jgi:hypothetical protein
MKKFLVAAALFVGAVFGAQLGFGGGIPNIPSSPQFSEPSQIIGTLNAFINQLNGNPLGSGGYAAQPGGIVSVGSFCSGTGTTLTNTCNGSRGQIIFTGTPLTVTTTGTTMTMVITNSAITTTSLCNGAFVTAFTAGSAVLPATFVPTAGSLSVVAVNAGTTANAVAAGTFAFNCFN